MPIYIIFITDRPGIKAIRMLWFEVMPPFSLYNYLSVSNIEENKIYMREEKNLRIEKVMRFKAEFVDIENIIKGLYDKTITMQKYFNHPNAKVQFTENPEDPQSIIYFEVRF